ncbi:LysR family transcriptional regulator [Variovorax sp. ZT4R33]|uniref:LysR family transcriptional regulator n=1 Tax=Variovorax sp. ZT4R33 TaxID=3443743 RepID=UPI003F478B85
MKLHTTQSAVSKRLAELEESLGGPLLHRTSHGLELTQVGRELLPLAEEAQRLWQRIAHDISVDKTLRGTFRVGVTELIAMTWLTRLIQLLQKLHPQVTIEPVVDAGLTLFERLEANKLDLAVMPGTFWGQAFESIKVAEVEQVWIASPRLQIPARALKPHEFADYPVIEQPAGASKNRFYEAWRAEHGFRFGKVMLTNSTTVLRELTISGFGLSQQALDYVRPDVRSGLLRVVKSDPMPPPLVYSAVFRRDNVSPTLERIVELAVKTCDFTLRASQHHVAPARALQRQHVAKRAKTPTGKTRG